MIVGQTEVRIYRPLLTPTYRTHLWPREHTCVRPPATLELNVWCWVATQKLPSTPLMALSYDEGQPI